MRISPTAVNAPPRLQKFCDLIRACVDMVGFDAEFADLCDKHMDATLPQATTDDQAQAILFFASDDSKGCTGQVLVVDNGMTL